MFIPTKKHRRSGAFHCVSSVCAVSAMRTVSTMRAMTTVRTMPFMTFVPLMSLMCAVSTAVTFMPLMTAAMPMCMILAVLMLVAVRALALIRASLKRSREMLLHDLIRAALHAGYERNTCLCKCRLCTRADAATDHNIRFRVVEEARECAMPLTDRVHNFRGLHCTVLDIIELELFCSAEMLLNLLIFIRYCDSHCMLSFILNPEDYRMFDPICAARNADALPADDCLRELVARRLVDARHRRTGHAHRGGTFLLRLPPIVDLTDRLELIQLEDNGLLRLLFRILRRKTPKIGISTDASTSLWSRHTSSISVI